MGCLDGLPPYGVGIVLVLGSAGTFSVMSLFVHMLSNSFGTFTIATTRFIIQTVAATAWMYVAAPKNGWFGHPSNRWPLVSRGMFGFLGMTAYYFSLGHLPLGDATAVMFMNPVLTAALAWLLLGESFGVVEGVSLLASFAGVICIARPPALFGAEASKHEVSGGSFGRAGLDFGRGWNLVINGMGALFASISFISLRMLSPKEPASVPTLYMGMFGGVAACTLALAVEGVQLPPQGWPYVLLCLIGALGFAGQLMLNRGFQLVEAAVGATMRNLDVALAFIFQAALLGERFSWWSVLGASLIMSCTALVAWNRTQRKETGSGGGSTSGKDGAAEVEGSAQAGGPRGGDKAGGGNRGEFRSISQAAARQEALAEEEDEEALVRGARGQAMDLEVLSGGSQNGSGYSSDGYAVRDRGGSGVLDASRGRGVGGGIVVLGGEGDGFDSRSSSDAGGIELVDGRQDRGMQAELEDEMMGESQGGASRGTGGKGVDAAGREGSVEGGASLRSLDSAGGARGVVGRQWASQGLEAGAEFRSRGASGDTGGSWRSREGRAMQDGPMLDGDSRGGGLTDDELSSLPGGGRRGQGVTVTDTGSVSGGEGGGDGPPDEGFVEVIAPRRDPVLD